MTDTKCPYTEPLALRQITSITGRDRCLGCMGIIKWSTEAKGFVHESGKET